MQDDDNPHMRYVGFKQSKRAIEEGKAIRAYVAEDCEKSLSDVILALCQKHGVAVELVPTMAQLGKDCGIDVGSAVAVIANA